MSVKYKMAAVGIASILLIAGASVLASTVLFRRELTELYTRDFERRLQRIEHEYLDVDAVSTASREEAEQIQNVLLRMQELYTGDGSTPPFVVTADGRTVNWPYDDLPQQAMTEAINPLLSGESASFQVSVDRAGYLVAVHFYAPWQWYTGYIVADSERFAGLDQFVRILIVLAAVTAVLALIAYAVAIRRMLRPLVRVHEAIAAVVAGDLTVRVEAAQNDEFGQIAGGMNELSTRLDTLLGYLRSATDANLIMERRLDDASRTTNGEMQQIADQTSSMASQITQLEQSVCESSSAASRIAQGVLHLNGRVEDQVSAVSQATASIEEMGGSLKSVADIAAARRQAADQLRETASDGGQRLRETVNAIREIQGSIDDVAGLVTMIQNIASQTNLLAMNAAIEAAHAGEQGRGFAVVADEIRKLAEGSSENSTSISSIIDSVVSRINAAAQAGEATEHSFAEISRGVAQVSDSLDEIAANAAELSAGSTQLMEAMHVLTDVSSDVKRRADASGQDTETIASTLRDFAELAERIRGGVQEIDQRTQSARAAMQEIAQISEQLHDRGETLMRSVDSFTTSDRGPG